MKTKIEHITKINKRISIKSPIQTKVDYVEMLAPGGWPPTLGCNIFALPSPAETLVFSASVTRPPHLDITTQSRNTLESHNSHSSVTDQPQWRDIFVYCI